MKPWNKNRTIIKKIQIMAIRAKTPACFLHKFKNQRSRQNPICYIQSNQTTGRFFALLPSPENCVPLFRLPLFFPKKRNPTFSFYFKLYHFFEFMQVMSPVTFSFVRMLFTVLEDHVCLPPGEGTPSAVSNLATALGERPCRKRP